MYLEAESDIDVVGEAGDGERAVALAEQLRPDVVVMDIRMPILDGVEATRRLTTRGTGEAVKVLVITTFDLDENVVEALRAGASGFLLKDATADELVHAVRVVAAGDALLAPAVTRRLLDQYAHRLPPPTPPRSQSVKNLTNREHQVLALVTRGYSNSAIARASPRRKQRQDACESSAAQARPDRPRPVGRVRLRERPGAAGSDLTPAPAGSSGVGVARGTCSPAG